MKVKERIDYKRQLRLFVNEPLIWVTKDRRRIPITQMADEHLLNTIAMLNRNYATKTKLCDVTIHDLVREAYRRGIVPTE